MKKLYALLIILIVIYIGINVSVNGFSVTSDVDSAGLSDIKFPTLDNFTRTKINDSAFKYVDEKNGVNILLEEINATPNVSEIYKNLSNGTSYTSSQEINLKGTPVYFLYNESNATYNADIFFTKNDANFKIIGQNITYENSDFFITQCKKLIMGIR